MKSTLTGFTLLAGDGQNDAKEHQSIPKAKQSLHGEALTTFNKLLQDLDGMNINPVTVPDEFNINFAQNLMDAQFNGIRR